MKEKSNNEIDLLLRRMSGHDGGSVRDAKATDQHLDVDELSSYAQNALPAAARARYTEHLADCSTCRKLVTELSLSLGTTAAAAHVETVSVPGGLKKFLASLFSPMVLRYAVPALGLIIVALIGFVALRQQNRQDSVAVRTAQEQPEPTVGASGVLVDKQSGAGFVNPNKETAAINKPERPNETPPKSGTVANDSAGTGPVATAAPVRDEKRAAEPPPPPKVEAEPARAKAAAPAADTAEQKKPDATTRKQETAAREPEAATAQNEPVRGLESASQSASKKAEENKTKDAQVQRRSAAIGGAARVFSGGQGQADTNDADLRTVSGRRFRKERGIWTDTAYDSSTATVNVARSSEQFRALVADEPEIKKIAEQLDGEVIVVWKGRAYRIR